MSKNQSDVIQPRSLAALREEFDPQGAAIEKDNILGEELLVQRLKPWKSKKGQDCVRVIAVLVSTGELVHFNGGTPMWNGIKDFAEHVPFTARITLNGEGDSQFYLLE